MSLWRHPCRLRDVRVVDRQHRVARERVRPADVRLLALLVLQIRVVPLARCARAGGELRGCERGHRQRRDPRDEVGHEGGGRRDHGRLGAEVALPVDLLQPLRVVDAVAGADDVLAVAVHVPGHPQPRLPVVLVHLGQPAVRTADGLQRLIGAVVRQPADTDVVVHVVAHAEIQRQTRRDLEVVLKVGGEVVVGPAPVVLRAVADQIPLAVGEARLPERLFHRAIVANRLGRQLDERGHGRPEALRVPPVRVAGDHRRVVEERNEAAAAEDAAEDRLHDVVDPRLQRMASQLLGEVVPELQLVVEIGPERERAAVVGPAFTDGKRSRLGMQAFTPRLTPCWIGGAGHAGYSHVVGVGEVLGAELVDHGGADHPRPPPRDVPHPLVIVIDDIGVRQQRPLAPMKSLFT